MRMLQARHAAYRAVDCSDQMALAAVQTHHGALDGEFAHQTQLAVLAHLTKSDDMRP